MEAMSMNAVSTLGVVTVVVLLFLSIAFFCTDWTGHLAADSPALGTGLPILYSSFDMDGEDWPNQSPIGADAYSPPVDDDSDTDGLINLHEFMLDTNPLVPDGSKTTVIAFEHLRERSC